MEKKDVKVGKYKYTDFCRMLDEKIPSSQKGRVYQLREWERYFNITKEGRNVTITEVYEQTLPKIDGRGKSDGSRGNADKFGDSFKNMILLYLCTDTRNPNFSMCTYMVDKFKILNDNYRYILMRDSETIKYLCDKYDIKQVYNCFGVLNRVVRDQFYRALNNLSEDCLISYEKINLVSLITDKTIMLDEYFDEYIEDCKRKALAEENLTYFTAFNNMKNRERFSNTFCRIVNADKEMLNAITSGVPITGTWRQIKINLSDDIDPVELSETIDDYTGNELADKIIETVNRKTNNPITEELFLIPKGFRTRNIEKRMEQRENVTEYKNELSLEKKVIEESYNPFSQ